jgi:cyclophilin family peptidyl-prolyl cis-trans isomerase
MKLKLMKRFLMATLAGATLFAFSACGESSPAAGENTTAPPSPSEPSDLPTPIERTGEIKIKLFPEIAPIAVQNFVDLAQDGYYDGKIVHRVIPDFMFQGGSPNGDGRSTDYDFFSIEPHPDAVHNYGALAMANAGPDRNSQQFYVVNGKTGAHGLNGGYTVFGQTVEGFDTIDGISKIEIKHNDSNELSAPVQPVTITSVTIHTFEGGQDPGSDPRIGNYGGEVELLNGDTYAVMTLKWFA